jgi:hypothetical protein
MKAIVIALLVFVAVASFHAAAGSPDFQGLKPWPSNSNVNTNSIEAKLSEALQSVSAMQKSNFNDSLGLNNTVTNVTAINETAANSTAINSTEINSTAANSSAEGAPASKSEGKPGSVSFTGNSSVSPHEVGSDSKASFNGFWGMEAKQKGIGKSGINSKTYLNGAFEVDKTVQFQDRGF